MLWNPADGRERRMIPKVPPVHGTFLLSYAPREGRVNGGEDTGLTPAR